MRGPRPSALAAVLYSSAVLACGGAEPESEGQDDGAEAPPVLEVTAVYEAETDQHLFLTNHDTLPAGWTTIRFTNSSPMLHFVFLDHLPGDRTSADLLAEVSPVFQGGMDLIMAGDPDAAMAQFANLPDWFPELVFRGGPGFLSPGRVTEATLYLEPGNYVLECYVKTSEGVFHWNLGMHADLHVTDEPSATPEPADPTIRVTLTDSAMTVEGEPTPGEHLVAVHFEEENPELFGKDLHLARLESTENVEDVVAWMDAFQVPGLMSTAEDPAPAVFLGGVHDMPLGNTAYFRVTLEPGEYMWVSELPVAEPSYRSFTVAR